MTEHLSDIVNSLPLRSKVMLLFPVSLCPPQLRSWSRQVVDAFPCESGWAKPAGHVASVSDAQMSPAAVQVVRSLGLDCAKFAQDLEKEELGLLTFLSGSLPMTMMFKAT